MELVRWAARPTHRRKQPALPRQWHPTTGACACHDHYDTLSAVVASNNTTHPSAEKYSLTLAAAAAAACCTNLCASLPPNAPQPQLPLDSARLGASAAKGRVKPSQALCRSRCTFPAGCERNVARSVRLEKCAPMHASIATTSKRCALSGFRRSNRNVPYQQREAISRGGAASHARISLPNSLCTMNIVSHCEWTPLHGPTSAVRGRVKRNTSKWPAPHFANQHCNKASWRTGKQNLLLRARWNVGVNLKIT